jgi:glutamyl-tRNA(Gln) amidotransferase subunit E
MLDPKKLNFEKLGFKSGLEVHHQIKSKRKLFCHCPPTLIESSRTPDYRFERYFRPVLGEMGDYDPGMLIEFEKGYRCIYHAFEECDCIYEQDEQPPYWPDLDSIKNVYKLAHWFDMTALVDEIIFARKQYLDGSITTGFQRTSIVGRDGYVKIDGKKIRISNVTIEEDAARKIRTENFGRTIYYNLDRLGVPLVEVITDHLDVDNPTTLLKLARMIGLTLRISGIGRRGIGAARQDVNISIRGGDRVELKGVQDLSVMEKWCRHESVRQYELIQIKNELIERQFQKEELEHTYTDLTHLFNDVPDNLVIMGVRLPKFGGLYNREIQPGKDFGLDVMEKANLITGVPLNNMFFSHELTSNSLRRMKEETSQENLLFPLINADVDQKIKSELQLGPNDAYFLAIHTQKWVIHALKKIVERSKMAIDGVPQETRRALLDGNSEFLRVIHGKGRLYPDTDTPVIDMDMEEIWNLKETVSTPPWELEEIFKSQYNLEFDHLETLVRHNHLELFQWLVEEKQIPVKLAYYFLENTLIALKRENTPIENLSREQIYQILNGASQNRYDAQIIPDVVKSFANDHTKSLDAALEKIGFKSIAISQLEEFYAEAIKIYDEKSKYNLSGLANHKVHKVTGIIMQQIHHALPGKQVLDFVQQKLQQQKLEAA